MQLDWLNLGTKNDFAINISWKNFPGGILLNQN